MPTEILGLLIGGLFGASLFLAGLADPDKIVGTLRLKDLHAMRTIFVFVFVGMLGVWILSLLGWAHMSVKSANLASGFVGGALLGVGFGLTGYCPGTGLACAAAGRLDALVSVLGMLLGALTYILVYPSLAVPLDKLLDYGKVTLPQITQTSPATWVLPIVLVGGLVLYLTRPRQATAPATPSAEG